jgi:hypothetical protein
VTTKQAVSVDGVLNDSAWQQHPAAQLPHTKTSIFLTHDADNLYIAATRKGLVTVDKKHLPWTTSLKGKDQDVWRDDALEVFIGSKETSRVIHLGLSASGATYDALSDTEVDDRAWNAQWTSAVVANKEELTWEIAIPISELEKNGLKRDSLTLNLMVDQSDTRADAHLYLGGERRNWRVKRPTSESLFSLGEHGRRKCQNLTALGLGVMPEVAPRTFDLKLHFAELTYEKSGQRVFDILLNGKVLVNNFDIVKAGGFKSAVIKEFNALKLSESLSVSFRTDPEKAAELPPPVICGVELKDTNYVPTGH